MQTEQNKLINFERIVLNDAIEAKNEATRRISKAHEEAIQSSKSEISDGENRRYAKEIDTIARKNNEMLVKNSTELRQKLITKRKDLIDGLFVKVEEKLKAYVTSLEYRTTMQKNIEDAVAQLGGNNICLMLCERDKTLDLNFEDLTIEYITDDMLGGFMLIDRERDILVDETYALKMKHERAGFLELSRIKL